MAPRQDGLVGHVRHVTLVKSGSSNRTLFASILGSVSSVAPGRLARGKLAEIQLDDSLERRSGSTVAQALREGGEPPGVPGLKRQKFVDRVAPTLRPAAAGCGDRPDGASGSRR